MAVESKSILPALALAAVVVMEKLVVLEELVVLLAVMVVTGRVVMEVVMEVVTDRGYGCSESGGYR